ncbi:MAG TPA: hypothetical protein VM686_37345 [Polyangiaceae bacterium]|nr:hypothetical protein [Polyangiaceae bacterium]
MKARVPAMLTRGLSAPQRQEFDQWWNTLATPDRYALRQHPGRAPAGVIARFVDAERPDDDGNENVDFYEYLVNHELSLEDGRTFHICSRHPAARALLARGWIPADFQCPREEAACPMRALLKAGNGSNVRLSLLRGARD